MDYGPLTCPGIISGAGEAARVNGQHAVPRLGKRWFSRAREWRSAGCVGLFLGEMDMPSEQISFTDVESGNRRRVSNRPPTRAVRAGAKVAGGDAADAPASGVVHALGRGRGGRGTRLRCDAPSSPGDRQRPSSASNAASSRRAFIVPRKRAASAPSTSRWSYDSAR